MNHWTKRTFLAAAAAALMGGGAAQAATYTYDFTTIFENANNATLGSSSPYATMKVTDTVDGVELIITSGLEAASEFIGGIWLNLVDNVPPLAASASKEAGSFALPTINYTPGNNQYSADGAGLFDLYIDFAQSEAGRFNGTTDSVRVFLEGLTSRSFNALSQCNQGGGPGNCPQGSAMHIQGIGTADDSVWATGDGGRPPSEIPLPAAAWLLGSGLMAMGAIGRRRTKGRA